MTPLEATASIPGVVALLVGIAEVRSSNTRPDKIRRLAPVILALALVIVFFLLERIDITAPQMPWLARGMTFLSLIVGVSGVVINHSRKSSSILMAVAGLMLAYYWALLSLPREAFLKMMVDELNGDLKRKIEPLEREAGQIKKRLDEIEGEVGRYVKALGQGKLSIDRLEVAIGG